VSANTAETVLLVSVATVVQTEPVEDSWAALSRAKTFAGVPE